MRLRYFMGCMFVAAALLASPELSLGRGGGGGGGHGFGRGGGGHGFGGGVHRGFAGHGFSGAREFAGRGFSGRGDRGRFGDRGFRGSLNDCFTSIGIRKRKTMSSRIVRRCDPFPDFKVFLPPK